MHNIAKTKYFKLFVKCDGAQSCIHQREERDAEWRSLGQITSCSNLRYETSSTDDKGSSSSRNEWTIETIPLIMTTKIITITSFPSFVSQIFRKFSYAHTLSFFRWGFWWRKKKTFARMSWRMRRSVLRLEGSFPATFVRLQKMCLLRYRTMNV